MSLTMGRTIRRAASIALLAALIAAGTACDPTPQTSAAAPGQPTSGPGSPGTVSTGATKFVTGDPLAGTEVWWYVPTTLRNGTKAPVVVLLHGFELLAPEIYQGLIDHLTQQGYLVIFPEFNLGGVSGILSDQNQNDMEARAIAAVNVALGQIGSKADLTKVYLFGHSLGGLIGGTWKGAGGVALKGLVLANPSLSSGAGIPAAVQGLVHITPIPFATLAPQTTAPTVILSGDSDTIAPTSESLQLYDLLTHASARSVYQAQTDNHGTPVLVADHLSPIWDSGVIPPSFMQAFGGSATKDAMDFRYYWAALDQLLAGNAAPTFNMGSWGDGTPVKPVLRLR